MKTIKEIETFYDNFYYPQFESMTPWHRMILEFFEDLEITNFSLLDIGCYRGFLSQWLVQKYGWNKKYLYGIDISSVACAIARKNMTQVIHGDVQSPETYNTLNIQKFKVIIATEIIEHIQSFEQVFTEAHNRLDEDGYFIVSFPNYINPSWYIRTKISEWLQKPELMFLQPIEHKYNYFFIKKQLKKFGFDIVDTRASLYLPGKFLHLESRKFRNFMDSCNLQFFSFSPMFICQKSNSNIN